VTAPKPKQIRLAINLLASGRHNAAWTWTTSSTGWSRELQARGRFRTAYESSTFRGNLGLPAPSAE